MTSIKPGNYYQFKLDGKYQIGQAQQRFIKFIDHVEDNPIMIAMHKVIKSDGCFPWKDVELLPEYFKKAGITYSLLPTLKVFPNRDETIAYSPAINVLKIGNH